jgi:hypothetical protein
MSVQLTIAMYEEKERARDEEATQATTYLWAYKSQAVSTEEARAR